MKKLALTALLGIISTATFAAPVGSTFTGFGLGADLTSTKYKGVKQATNASVLVDYGFDYGNDWVGLVEGKVKLTNSKLVDENNGVTKISLKEKTRVGISYLQGYRATPDLLPYAKVSYAVANFKADIEENTRNHHSTESISETISGFGIGVGAKYALSSNFELGAEYLRTQFSKSGDSLKGNNFSATATYRF